MTFHRRISGEKFGGAKDLRFAGFSAEGKSQKFLLLTKVGETNGKKHENILNRDRMGKWNRVMMGYFQGFNRRRMFGENCF
jgi:hypothetical protein